MHNTSIAVDGLTLKATAYGLRILVLDFGDSGFDVITFVARLSSAIGLDQPGRGRSLDALVDRLFDYIASREETLWVIVLRGIGTSSKTRNEQDAVVSALLQISTDLQTLSNRQLLVLHQ